MNGELPVLAALTREQIAEAVRDYVLRRAGVDASVAGEARIDYAVVNGDLNGAAIYVAAKRAGEATAKNG